MVYVTGKIHGRVQKVAMEREEFQRFMHSLWLKAQAKKTAREDIKADIQANKKA